MVGWVGARWFLDALQSRGFAAPSIEVDRSALPLFIALALTAAIATVASAIGVRRVTRLSPAAALSDSASEPRRIGWIRSLFGCAALADSAALLGVNLAGGGTEGAEGAFLALLVLMAALGLLGPVLAGLAARVLGTAPRRLSPRIGWLADANLRGHVRRLSSAVIPLALLVSLACNFLFVGPTMERGATPEAARDLSGLADPNENWLRLLELAMFVLLAAVAIVNTLVALTAERRHEFRLLKLLGATNRELWRMLGTETALIVLIGLALGTTVGAVTLVCFSEGATGSPIPSVSIAPYAAIVAATAVLAAPSVLITGHRILSRSDLALAAGSTR